MSGLPRDAAKACGILTSMHAVSMGCGGHGFTIIVEEAFAPSLAHLRHAWYYTGPRAGQRGVWRSVGGHCYGMLQYACYS
jgi:hypothetical protein